MSRGTEFIEPSVTVMLSRLSRVLDAAATECCTGVKKLPDGHSKDFGIQTESGVMIRKGKKVFVILGSCYDNLLRVSEITVRSSTTWPEQEPDKAFDQRKYLTIEDAVEYMAPILKRGRRRKNAR